VHARRARLDHRLHQLEAVQRAAEARLRVRHDRCVPVALRGGEKGTPSDRNTSSRKKCSPHLRPTVLRACAQRAPKLQQPRKRLSTSQAADVLRAYVLRLHTLRSGACMAQSYVSSFKRMHEEVQAPPARRPPRARFGRRAAAHC
jgi:hypothetical protein